MVTGMKPALRSFGYGLLLTGFAALASLAVTVRGFHNLYYLAVMLPVFMAVYLLLAWLIYLRRTAFLLHTGPRALEQRSEAPLRGVIAALLWSACQLALLATILYRSLGLGARYF
jgi:hypothetical protein